MQERRGDAEARAGFKFYDSSRSQAATLALLVISLICWGSWANTLKLAGKWRFELYYYDFALGFALLAVVAAFTGGSFNSGELTFQDNFLITGYRNMAYVDRGRSYFQPREHAAGGDHLGGWPGVAFTITFATALVVSTAWSLIFEAPNGILLSGGGAALLLVALVMGAAAYSSYLGAQADAARKDASQRDPRAKRGKISRSRGAALAIGAGRCGRHRAGSVPAAARHGKPRRGKRCDPMAAPCCSLRGFSLSTAIIDPFFFNFPVAGGPIGLTDYFKGTGKQHSLGLLGGVIAGVGVPGGNAGARRALGDSNCRHAQLCFEPGRPRTGRRVGACSCGANSRERASGATLLFLDHVDPAGASAWGCWR